MEGIFLLMEVRTIRTRVTLISEKEPVFRLLKREFFLSYVLLAVQHVIYHHKAFENSVLRKGT